MGKRLRLALGGLVLVLALAGVSVPLAGGATSGVPGQYIVVLKDGANSAAVARDHEKRFGAQVQFVYASALEGYSATIDSAAVPGIQSDPRVLFVEQDDIFAPPKDPRPPHASPGVPQPDQVMSNGPHRVAADLSSTVSGDGQGAVNVNVAVLDSGIDWKHPDLNVAGGVNCMPGERSTDFFDRQGHGTMVGGFIGALDNAIGRVGVAPGANLFAVRVLDGTLSGTDSVILCGIDWVASTRTNHNKSDDIAVANMSLGGPGVDDGNCGLSSHDALHLAICHTASLGVAFVVSAGNDGVDIASQSPAGYHEVLTATALADDDGKPGGLGGPFASGCPQETDDAAASFSNFATLPSDQAHVVAAPGVCISSTWVDSQYAFWSGTSFASPIVAGTVALCIASGPCAGLSPPQIIQKIVSDATAYNQAHPDYGFQGDPLHPISGKYYGYLIRAGSY